MLVKPDVDEALIAACLEAEYGLTITDVAFLPVGADVNTAAYRAVAGDGIPYFAKLRRGAFDEVAVALPRCLSEQGVAQVMAPLPTRRGGLWARLEPFGLVLYPFVEGRDAYEARLSAAACVELGSAVRAVHAAALPAGLAGRIPREEYSPRWRDRVARFLAQAGDMAAVDAVAAEVLALLRQRRRQLYDLVERTEALAQALRACSGEYVVCHSDLHAGNILLGSDSTLHIVDWDAPIMAPRERDLMYAGGGLLGGWHAPDDEAALFYRGYGAAESDVPTVAYYRYERVVQDIAEFCDQLLPTAAGGEDRERSLGHLRSIFESGSVLDIAYRTDPRAPSAGQR